MASSKNNFVMHNPSSCLFGPMSDAGISTAKKNLEVAHACAVADLYQQATRLRTTLGTSFDAVTSLVERLDKLIMQVACRVGGEWRNMDDDSLTPQKIQPPRTALQTKLCSVLIFIDSTVRLFDQSVPEDIRDVEVLVRGQQESSAGYLADLKSFSTFYNGFTTACACSIQGLGLKCDCASGAFVG